jgi:hypothetical protein
VDELEEQYLSTREDLVNSKESEARLLATLKVAVPREQYEKELGDIAELRQENQNLQAELVSQRQLLAIANAQLTDTAIYQTEKEQEITVLRSTLLEIQSLTDHQNLFATLHNAAHEAQKREALSSRDADRYAKKCIYLGTLLRDSRNAIEERDRLIYDLRNRLHSRRAVHTSIQNIAPDNEHGDKMALPAHTINDIENKYLKKIQAIGERFQRMLDVSKVQYERLQKSYSDLNELYVQQEIELKKSQLSCKQLQERYDAAIRTDGETAAVVKLKQWQEEAATARSILFSLEGQLLAAQNRISNLESLLDSKHQLLQSREETFLQQQVRKLCNIDNCVP